MMVMRGLPAPVILAPIALQKVRQVHHLRFAGGAFDDGDAVGQRGGHHDVGGAEHGRAGAAAEEHSRADQAPGAGVNVAAFDRDPGSERFKTFQMEVDGSRADDAAAGQGNRGLLEPREQRAHDADRAAHLADQIVVARSLNLAGMDAKRVALLFYLGAEPGEDLAHELHVAQVGHAADDARLAGQQRRRHDRQHGVLGAADGHVAVERHSTFNKQTIHGLNPTHRPRSFRPWRLPLRLPPGDQKSWPVSVVLAHRVHNPVLLLEQIPGACGLAIAKFEHEACRRTSGKDAASAASRRIEIQAIGPPSSAARGS